jgi:hypothetical protein
MDGSSKRAPEAERRETRGGPSPAASEVTLVAVGVGVEEEVGGEEWRCGPVGARAQHLFF